MTPDEIAKLSEENESQRARLRKQAEEKASLQLIIRLIEQLNPLSGIKDMVRAMLYSIVETIGGTNIKLYYFVEGELHFADFHGESRVMADFDDPLVVQVAASSTFIEEHSDADSALLLGEVVPGAWVWGFPLLVGKELLGVIKLENLNLSSGPMRNYLPIFFSHAALLLSNEIRNYSRKKAEEALRVKSEELDLYFTSALDLLCIADTEGYFRKLNPEWEKNLGYPVQELLGRKFLDLVHPDDLENTLQAIATLSAQSPVLGFTNRYRHKDGSYRWLEWRSYPVGTKIYAAARDITEHIRSEQELMRYKNHLEDEVQRRTSDLVLARDAAEAANLAKSAFLASMSHELRTPLNAILGFSSLLRQDSSLSREQIQNLDIINRSGSHLLTLINDVLEMSKIESGRMQLDNIPFDLGAMVRDVTDMMEVRAREKNLQLLIDQDSPFPRYINGDEARLRQILINLLGNAVKFTQQGGVTLRLGSRQNKIAHLVVEVEDSGPGISVEDRQRLFQPFVQLGKQAGDNRGTGLGLAITRKFVQLMGGTITLESTPGKGSLFRIELPLQEASESNVAKQKITTGEVIGRAPGQVQYRILIVEDQLENQLLLTKLMQRIGLEVKVAENGSQGLELFQNWQPHLIWMDRRMPVMDGIEATKVIRKLPGGEAVKIVAVTASAFTEQRDEMLAAGMDDFVRKPYRFSEIYDCLGKQLGIQYIYAEAQDDSERSPPVVLTAAMLAVLPMELRGELRDALESLNSERIAAVVAKVASYDAALQQALLRLVDDFDYPPILKILTTN